MYCILRCVLDNFYRPVMSDAGWCVRRLLPKRDPIALLADFPHVALSVVSNRRLSLW